MVEPTKPQIARRFGAHAAAYAASEGHARGADLAVVVRLANARPGDTALDVATGAGHTALALAPHVARIVAADLAPEMLVQVRRQATGLDLGNVETLLCDVGDMPFADGGFDIVTSRIAAHHFLDLDAGIHEMARVLRQGGRMVIEDSCSPADPALEAFINTVERLRDPTHVHSHTERSWITALGAAGMTVVHAELHRKRHDIESWMDRSGLRGAHRHRVLGAFAGAPVAARRHFSIEYADGRPLAHSDDKLIVAATRGARASGTRPATAGVGRGSAERASRRPPEDRTGSLATGQPLPGRMR